jgi:hypothetical protein
MDVENVSTNLRWRFSLGGLVQEASKGLKRPGAGWASSGKGAVTSPQNRRFLTYHYANSPIGVI